jgi:predicted dienelactone hydrolase
MILKSFKFKRSIGIVLISMFFSIVGPGQQVSELPTPTGSFGIGRTAFRWVDKSRPEVMPDKKSDYRELLVYLFYPTESKASGKLATYFPHLKETEAFEEQFGKDFFKNNYGKSYPFLAGLRIHTVENAKIAKGRFPLLIFSHGGGIPVLFYTAIIEELVSHGYIVAAVEHSYDGATVVFPDGHIITQTGWDQDSQRSEKDKATFHMSRYRTGAEDDSFILDQLEELNSGNLSDAAKQFRGEFDTEKIGALGHSLGGMIRSSLALATGGSAFV